MAPIRESVLSIWKSGKIGWLGFSPDGLLLGALIIVVLKIDSVAIDVKLLNFYIDMALDY